MRFWFQRYSDFSEVRSKMLFLWFLMFLIEETLLFRMLVSKRKAIILIFFVIESVLIFIFFFRNWEWIFNDVWWIKIMYSYMFIKNFVKFPVSYHLEEHFRCKTCRNIHIWSWKLYFFHSKCLNPFFSKLCFSKEQLQNATSLRVLHFGSWERSQSFRNFI